MIDRIRRLLGIPRPEVDKPNADERREARELGAENKRHIEAIEYHVSRVANRVRADAERADERVRGR